MIIIEPTMTSWLILFLQKMYNTVEIGTSKYVILRLILIGVLVWCIKRFLLYGISVVKSRFICNIKQNLKHDIFANALGIDTSNISGIASSGEYISIFTNDITIIEQKLFSNVIGVCSKVISIVILGSSFFSMNGKLAAFMVGFGVIVVFVPPAFSKKLNETNLNYSRCFSKFTQKIKEFFHAYATIKNYSIEKIILRKFDQSNSDLEDSKFTYDCSLSLADSVGSLLTWFTRIIVIGAGLIMVANGEILIGTVMAAQAFVEELASPLQGLIENINAIKSVKSIVNRISEITQVNAQPTQSDMGDSPEPELVTSMDIEFRDLTIVAQERKIVNDFSFTFRQGGKYLVIGKNGSGKSSIFKALKKGFENYDGQILLNGMELRNISSKQLSSLTSYLNENVAIFTGSIEENITFGRQIPPEILQYAIKNAHVELRANRLVGEDGFDISSGEQRRIEIARSLVSPATFMIFDEVVSTLDIETAYEIEREALSYEGKTVVFISHNFSGKLVRDYDEILVIKDGCLLAHGNYDTLLAECDYFRHICEIKFG